MLPKQHRLKESTEFDLVYKKGRKHFTPFFVLYVYKPQSDNNPWKKLPKFGFVASKKVGKAVERNRAKRILRDAVQIELSNLKPNFAAVVIAFHNVLTTDQTTLYKHLHEQFEKADILKNSASN